MVGKDVSAPTFQLFPIPKQQRDANDKLKQNPGILEQADTLDVHRK
jgi:hypothetical protein